MTFKFKNGTSVEGDLVSQALFVLLIKSEGKFYLINRFSLEDSSIVDSELDSEDTDNPVQD